MNAVLDFVKSLNLEEKLSPRRNADIIWFYIFMPCVVAYFVILTSYINAKPTIGSIEILDTSFASLIYPGKEMEIIATDVKWAEGPLWIQDDAASLNYLMFSDTEANRIYKWEDGKGMFTVGKTIYIENSGCKSDLAHCSALKEPGSNGLVRRDSTSLDLLACQHGERAISLLRENGTRSAVATHFNHSRLNSPNDLIMSPDGHLYFTDPPYGLETKLNGAVGQELPHNGVYMIRKEYLQMAMESGEATDQVWLMDGTLSKPNGLAFSPDFSKLYVSHSDKAAPFWKVYEVADNGLIKNGRVFFDAMELYEKECAKESDSACANVGLPDGLKVDINGNLFATGPGGVLVISPAGKLFMSDNTISNLL